MDDYEVMTMQLTFDPIAERAKALNSLCDCKCDTPEVSALIVEAIKLVVESMKPQEPEQTDNVTPFYPVLS